MKPACPLIILLLAAILSGCMTAPTPPGHATVILHDAQGHAEHSSDRHPDR